MKKRYIFLMITLLSGLWGCDNENFLYNDISRLWLSGDAAQNATTDSVIFSFRLYNSEVQTDTIFVIGNLIGKASPEARSFKLEMVAEESNVAPTDYTFGTMVLPANQISARVPVIVKRQVPGLNLRQEMARLQVRIVANENFGLGEEGTREYTLLWCDFFTQPSTWSVISPAVGVFTQAKYKFIIDHSGLTDFEVFRGNSMKRTSFLIQLKEALTAYNSNPANAGREEGWPYLNDDGTPLTF